jgi:hypothetical protein
MTLPEFLYRFDGFANFLVNALICVITAKLYHGTRKRCLLLVSIGSGVGAFLVVLPELQDGGQSSVAWYFEMTLRIACSVVWLIGCLLLFRDYSDLIRGTAQLGAAPNGGPATQVDNSNVTEGPPSVS